MLGRAAVPNAESIRAVLVMPAGDWARDVPGLREFGIDRYDAEDPRKRNDQVLNMISGRS